MQIVQMRNIYISSLKDLDHQVRVGDMPDVCNLSACACRTPTEGSLRVISPGPSPDRQRNFSEGRCGDLAPIARENSRKGDVGRRYVQ